MLYTVTYKKLGGCKYTDYIPEENLKNILSFFVEDENLSLVSVIPEGQKLETPGFAHVCWDKDDLANALEVSSIPATEENIATVLNALDNHFFTDYLISAGWDYIYKTIENTDF